MFVFVLFLFLFFLSVFLSFFLLSLLVWTRSARRELNPQAPDVGHFSIHSSLLRNNVMILFLPLPQSQCLSDLGSLFCLLSWCFTSAETIWLIRDENRISFRSVRPDVLVMVDWALNTNYMSVCCSV